MAEGSVSLWTPLLYVSTLLVAYVVFSNTYRKRKIQRLAETPQFYQNNFARDIYQQLKSTEKVPKKLLIAALFAWAVEDITRTVRYRETEPIVTDLLQNGLIGESVLERYSGSKILNDKEIQEIAVESQNELGVPWESLQPVVFEILQQHAVRRRLGQLDVYKAEFYEKAGASPESFKPIDLAGALKKK